MGEEDPLCWIVFQTTRIQSAPGPRGSWMPGARGPRVTSNKVQAMGWIVFCLSVVFVDGSSDLLGAAEGG